MEIFKPFNCGSWKTVFQLTIYDNTKRVYVKRYKLSIIISQTPHNNKLKSHLKSHLFSCAYHVQYHRIVCDFSAAN